METKSYGSWISCVERVPTYMMLQLVEQAFTNEGKKFPDEFTVKSRYVPPMVNDYDVLAQRGFTAVKIIYKEANER